MGLIVEAAFSPEAPSEGHGDHFPLWLSLGFSSFALKGGAGAIGVFFYEAGRMGGLFRLPGKEGWRIEPLSPPALLRG